MTDNEPNPARVEAQRSRVGYIARLPKALRKIVNRMLDDGKPFQEIIDELEKHRDQWPPDITALAHHHLVSWRGGGYQDWVHHQEQLAHLRTREEFTLDFISKTDPGELYKAALRLGLSRIVEALYQLNILGCQNSLHPSVRLRRSAIRHQSPQPLHPGVH